MRQLKTEAVIMDSTDVFEADRSFLLFTREAGKLRARAKGVRRPTSRLTGHLLSYLPAQVELLETKGNWLIVQAQTLPGYEGGATYPADALLFLRQAGVIAESMNRLFIDREPHPDIYEGLIYTLDRLRVLAGSQPDPLKAHLVTTEFLVKCLAELGYRAELEQCVVTGERISEEFVGWSSQAGGVLSRAGFDLSGGEGRPLRYPRTVVVLRQLLRPQFVAERLGVPEAVQAEAVEIAEHYLQTQIGQPLRSLGK